MHTHTDDLKALREAERKAEQLFNEAIQSGFVKAGRKESEINKDIYELAARLLGIKKYWHKRIVRGGPNTLLPYRENPPDYTLQADDIIFFDFGPVFEEWEADFGRTYVLGENPHKLRLLKDIEMAWQEGKAFFEANRSHVSGADLYRFTQEKAKEKGWVFGNEHAGHLIGNFPHEKIIGDETEHYIHPENKLPMKRSGTNGQELFWIYEIHFIDPQAGYGGFFEQILG